MSHFRVTLAYDGTDFAGWQSQGRGAGARTVQGVLESALERLGSGERVAVAGAGRTDAGVHALGQVASFDLPGSMLAGDLQRALNALLPRDVRVLGAALAPAAFHARRSAVSKLYRYELDTGRIQWPTRRRQAGHVPWTLDAGAMLETAALFVGRHDFASLASSGGSLGTSVRTITRSEARFVDAQGTGLAGAPESTLVYEVEADGFLRKMVRSLVGGLIAAGRGASSVEELRRALAARDRRGWPPPAPACGLTLMRVDYGPMLE
jgi:tRNA pseudouridine38-40 synthase